MFDAITSALISSGPPLGGLDRDKLPAEFTKTYAQLVSMRLLLREGTEPTGPVPDLDRVRRLANAYETYAAVLPERPDREAAAFIAATAHGLLSLAGRVTSAVNPPTNVSSSRISSDISACLLFIASGYLADAAEVARRFRVEEDTEPISKALVRSIQAIAVGRLGAVRGNAAAVREITTSTVDPVARLYGDVLAGLEELVTEVLEGTQVARSRELFESVRDRSVYVVPNSSPATMVSTFAGPHHLAVLLIEAGSALRGLRVSAIAPPSGVGGNEWLATLRDIARQRPFLWRNHAESVTSGYLDVGVSAVLSFPTGAGKSTMAELKIASALASGRSVLYLVPTHALVSQVVRDLEGMFSAAGVRDSFIRDDAYAEVDPLSKAQIAVMTPERALTLLGATPSDFEDIGLIVMDECHLLHPSRRDGDRRSLDAMLCMLLVTERSAEADVLLMSAMMANHREIAEWVSELTGRKCLPLSMEWKPTRQVRGCVVFDKNRIAELEATLSSARRARTTKAPDAKTRALLTAVPHALFSLLQTWATTHVEDYVHLALSREATLLGANKSWSLTANRNATSASLAVDFARRGMRTLVFAEDPKAAGSLAKRVAEVLTVKPQLDEKEHRLLTIAQDEAGSPNDVLGLTDGGAVVHHGLLLPTERRLVESLYRRDHDNVPVVLVGTPTLAQGVNLPAEVVIMSGDDRYDPRSDRAAPLEPQELLNAVGRAGRAGFASVGVVLVVPGAIVSCEPGKMLTERWFQLQKDVFSKLDQCVTIDDPLEAMVDLIQTGSEESEFLARYFINRLPLSEESLRRIFSRSLGGFRARKQLETTKFDEKVEHAIQKRAATPEPEAEWVCQFAVASGIDLAIAQQIAADVTENAERWQCDSVLELVERFFDWMVGDPARTRAFSRTVEVEADGTDASLSGLPIETARALVRRWVSGGTLRDLERVIVGEKPIRAGCVHARRFVIRGLPDVAYGIGLVAHAYRMAVGDEGVVPLPLAVGAECVKRGLSSPEMLALSYVQQAERSRTEYANELATLDVEVANINDDFRTVVRRIEAVLTDQI